MTEASARTTVCVAAIAVALACAPATFAEPNPVQHGENGLCADFNALWMHDDRLLGAILVAGGTAYRVTHEGGAAAYVDFYDADGRWAGDSSTHPVRSPTVAALGTVCVGVLGGGWPDAPAAGATWTYQDGL